MVGWLAPCRVQPPPGLTSTLQRLESENTAHPGALMAKVPKVIQFCVLPTFLVSVNLKLSPLPGVHMQTHLILVNPISASHLAVASCLLPPPGVGTFQMQTNQSEPTPTTPQGAHTLATGPCPHHPRARYRTTRDTVCPGAP